MGSTYTSSICMLPVSPVNWSWMSAEPPSSRPGIADNVVIGTVGDQLVPGITTPTGIVSPLKSTDTAALDPGVPVTSKKRNVG
jgi:hypothetical protein